MNPLASNRLDGGPPLLGLGPFQIVLPGALPGVVPSVVPIDVVAVSTDALFGVEPGVVPKDVRSVVAVSLADVVKSGDVVGGNVGGGGSSHLSQIKNPFLLLGPSVGSFVYEKISSLASFMFIQS